MAVLPVLPVLPVPDPVLAVPLPAPFVSDITPTLTGGVCDVPLQRSRRQAILLCVSSALLSLVRRPLRGRARSSPLAVPTLVARWRIVLGIGLVVALAGVLVEGFRLGVPYTPPGYVAGRPIVPKDLMPAGPDLVPDAAMAPVKGSVLASGLHAWGASPRLADVPVSFPPRFGTAAGRAELVSLNRGDTGGVWFTVPVRSGHWYDERIVVLVRRVDRGAVVSVNLEWYRVTGTGAGSVSRSLGAYVTLLHRAGSTPVAVRQFGYAPAGANRAHVVVDVVRGGEVLVVGAQLHLAVRRH